MARFLSQSKKLRCMLLILCVGIVLFLLELGSTGLVDETPPLFAAAGRGMSVTGDWLTPRVNGLPRFDKPPLVYWLMGLGYSIPYQHIWDPLGSWAGRLPSAISSLFLMVLLGQTILEYPQENDPFPRRTAITIAFAFGLSPLVIIWSRIAVSDALLASTLGSSLLFLWRRYSNPASQNWYIAWFFLGLAVLTKGPVAIVLLLMTLFLFGIQQQNIIFLLRRIRFLKGIIITLIISLPWYLIELFVEGKPFWDSFFGYHNFQRFTSVVNSHSQPWWFFFLILFIASLPFTPLLLFGIFQVISEGINKSIPSSTNSLKPFAACWLISVFVLFTFAATKLPSYWLPATPAAALLIGLASNSKKTNTFLSGFAWLSSIFMAMLLAAIFWSSPLWLMSISDPEIPNLGESLLSSKIILRAAACLSISSIIGLILYLTRKFNWLLAMQGPLIIFQLLVMIPMWRLGDNLRQLPLRRAASLLVSNQRVNEPIAMVGALKPSIHFYTNRIILYEGRSPSALLNLSERLNEEKRDGWEGRSVFSDGASSTFLLLIDDKTFTRSHWKGVRQSRLGKFGIYNILRIDRLSLEKRASKIYKSGIRSDWKVSRKEKF